jgi:hypothetical protein
MAQLRLAGTSCAGTGPPRRKAALADHYVAAGDTQAPAPGFQLKSQYKQE